MIRSDSVEGHHDIKDFVRDEAFMQIACGSPRDPRAIRLRLPTSRQYLVSNDEVDMRD